MKKSIFLLNQDGFTLFELMIAIALIAILTAIALPAYQGYIQKAAMTEMLQTISPIKSSIELCALENGNLNNCNSDQNGVINPKATHYVKSVTTIKGEMTLIGNNTLSDLTVKLKPILTDGNLTWQRTCQSPNNPDLKKICSDLFRFDNDETEK